jgi:hypothetical protein
MGGTFVDTSRDIHSMSVLEELITRAIDDFGKVAALANAEFLADSITVEITT